MKDNLQLFRDINENNTHYFVYYESTVCHVAVRVLLEAKYFKNGGDLHLLTNTALI
jgi:hypothetical protein